MPKSEIDITGKNFPIIVLEDDWIESMPAIPDTQAEINKIKPSLSFEQNHLNICNANIERYKSRNEFSMIEANSRGARRHEANVKNFENQIHFLMQNEPEVLQNTLKEFEQFETMIHERILKLVAEKKKAINARLGQIGKVKS